jgi:hypothetical protein
MFSHRWFLPPLRFALPLLSKEGIVGRLYAFADSSVSSKDVFHSSTRISAISGFARIFLRSIVQLVMKKIGFSIQIRSRRVRCECFMRFYDYCTSSVADAAYVGLSFPMSVIIICIFFSFKTAIIPINRDKPVAATKSFNRQLNEERFNLLWKSTVVSFFFNKFGH